MSQTQTTICGYPIIKDEKSGGEYIESKIRFSYLGYPEEDHTVKLFTDFDMNNTLPEEYDGFVIRGIDWESEYTIAVFKSHLNAINYFFEHIIEIYELCYGEPHYGFNLEAFTFEDRYKKED